MKFEEGLSLMLVIEKSLVKDRELGRKMKVL